MDRTLSGVVKASQVRLAEPRQIGQSAPGEPAGRRPGATAKIVQQAPGEAVIEIACDCGQAIRLRCTFDLDAPGGDDNS